MISGSFTDADPWFLLFGAGPVLLVGAGWLFMAATLVFRGNDVDKPNRMAQFYGYSVCLLAIIFALFSTTSIIDTAFERANPLQSEERFGFGASLIWLQIALAPFGIARPSPSLWGFSVSLSRLSSSFSTGAGFVVSMRRRLPNKRLKLAARVD